MGSSLSNSIIFIGTGNYINFLPNYYASMKSHFLRGEDNRFHVFTDNVEYANWPNDMQVYKIDHMQWPFITLLRFNFIHNAIDEICKSENCVFADADLLWMKDTTESDLFRNKKYFGVQHPGFVFEPHKATFERNEASTAHVTMNDDLTTYWQGCLWGAKSQEFANMINILKQQVETDVNNNIVALWHDESHLNRFFINVKNEVNTLHPGYATPERWDHIKEKFSTVALHLHKSMQEFPRFEGIK